MKTKTFIHKFCLLYFSCLLLISPLYANILAHEDSLKEDTEDWPSKLSPDSGDDLLIKDFFLASLPKSGTHLMIKLLVMLTGRKSIALHALPQFFNPMSQEEFEIIFTQTKASNNFIWGHPSYYYECSRSYLKFAEGHPELVSFLQIRDLRDVVVSYIYYFHDRIQAELNGNSNFDDMLTHILSASGSTMSSALKIWVESALMWFDCPQIILTRFESFVGPSGGGDAELQRKTILEIASALNINLSEDQLETVVRDLFGNKEGPQVAITFRSGQIGGWRNYFKPQHVKLFNENWGKYQLLLGYPLAELDSTIEKLNFVDNDLNDVGDTGVLKNDEFY